MEEENVLELKDDMHMRNKLRLTLALQFALLTLLLLTLLFTLIHLSIKNFDVCK